MAEQNLWLTEQRPWPPEGLARMCAFGGDLLSSELKRLAHIISTDLRAQEIATAADGPEPVFRMDFSTSIMTDGALRLRRLYWSVQRQIGGRFVARTFAYHRKTGDGTWFDFPEDPDLPGAASVLADLGGYVVLRYVPMRRLTVLQHSEEAGPVILKFKRMDRITEAAGLLDAVNLAAAKSCESFTTPQLLHVQHADGMFAQTYLPGMPIASAMLLNEISLPQITRVLAELAALKVVGLPVLTHRQMAQDTAAMAQWVARMLPEAAPALTEIVDALVRATPDDGDTVFCHGDMGADQVLVDANGQWALLDFDRAHIGSPCRDIASLMVKWQRDQGLVLSADRLADAFNASGLRTLDRPALHWHLACMEIHHLQQIFKKGRATVSSALLAIARVEAACRECRA